MKRIFFALEIKAEAPLSGMISSLRAMLGNEKISWVNAGNIHLTLAFLGETDEAEVAAADIAVRDKCKGFKKFYFNLKGTGVFRNYHDPRVIWAGIDDCKELIRLSELTLSGLKDAGFRLEERPFRPHVTLGRIKYLKDPALLESSLGKYHDIFFQKVYVDEIILFESILKPTGPVYKPLGRIRLS